MKDLNFKVLIKGVRIIVSCFLIGCLILMIWFDEKFWFKMLLSNFLLFGICSLLDDEVSNLKVLKDRLKKSALKR